MKPPLPRAMAPLSPEVARRLRGADLRAPLPRRPRAAHAVDKAPLRTRVEARAAAIRAGLTGRGVAGALMPLAR